MERQLQNDTRSKIIKALRTRGAQRLTDLANVLRKSPSTISYHLDILKESGTLIVTEEKLYNIAEEGDVEKAILNAIVEYGPSNKSKLFKSEQLNVFGNRVDSAYQNLLTKGLITERDGIVKLTRWGTNKLSICYVCYKPVKGLSISAFIAEKPVLNKRTQLWFESITDVLIHPKCFPKFYNETNVLEDVLIPDNCFCDYCGLPLHIGVYRKLTQNIYVSLEELRKHMSIVEEDIYRKFEKIPSYFFDWQDIDRLITKIEEEAEQKRISYDSKQRKQELWHLFNSIMKEKKDRTERMISNLFSPIEIAYSNIFGPWEYPEEQDIVKKGTVEYVPFEGEYGMVFVTESGEKVHPYCGCLLDQSKSNIHFQS